MAKIIFIQDLWHEFLGVMHLSSILKKNKHECDVLLGKDKDILSELKKQNPDIIAFSTMSIQHEWALEMAKAIKNMNLKSLVLFGGPHVTFFPDSIKNPYIDAICRGEGEHAFLELANAIDKKKPITKIKNIWVKKNGKIYRNPVRPLIKDLDELPFPDRDLYRKYPYFEKQQYTVFMATRGCPYNCSFCFNKSMATLYKKQKYVRFRSVKNCIEEIKQTNEKTKIKTVIFTDSSFNLNKKWLLDFLKEYKKQIKIPFSFNIRPNLVDKDMVKAIAETKLCASVRFAIETGNEKLRNQLLRKGVTNKQIINASRLFKKYKIPVIIFAMYGLPRETLAQALETIKMIQMIKPYVVSNYIFMPFPGLEITEFALNQGIMNPRDIKKLGKSPYKIHRSILKQAQIKETSNLHKFSVIAIRFPILLPIIKKLVKIRPNILYDMVFNFSQVTEWRRWSNTSWPRIVVEIIKNYSKYG